MDSAGLWDDICDIVVKTMCTAQPFLASTYKAGQHCEYFNGMCFEVLGFDILIDSDLKPWLLEVNFTPSFTTDSPLDLRIKSQIIADTLKLINLPQKLKKAFNKIQGQYFSRRTIGRITSREQQELKNIAQDIRNSYEVRNQGAFIKIYPCDDYFCYQKYLKLAGLLWNGGRMEILYVPKIKRNESVMKFDKENRSLRPVKNLGDTSPKTPVKSDALRTSPSRSKYVPRVISFGSAALESKHAKSKSHFIGTAADLHF